MTNLSGVSDLMTRESSVEPMTGELVCSTRIRVLSGVKFLGESTHLFIRMYVRMYTHARSTAHVYPMTLEITLMHAACIYQLFFQNNDEDAPGAVANYSDAMRGRYVCGMIVV